MSGPSRMRITKMCADRKDYTRLPCDGKEEHDGENYFDVGNRVPGGLD